MVLGSPKQRNLLPGVSYDDAEAYATEVLHAAVPACAQFGVTIALEPLGPAEGDFCSTPRPGSGWPKWSARPTASCTST